MLEVKNFTSVDELKNYVDSKLKELEREAEILADTLDEYDEFVESFEELRKLFPGEVKDAYLETKIDDVRILVEPNPLAVRDVLARRADEVSKLIHGLKKVSGIIEKLEEILKNKKAFITLVLKDGDVEIYIKLLKEQG